MLKVWAEGGGTEFGGGTFPYRTRGWPPGGTGALRPSELSKPVGGLIGGTFGGFEPGLAVYRIILAKLSYCLLLMLMISWAIMIIFLKVSINITFSSPKS